jgi:tetratricopeptide (TPR) repeat protein
LDNLANYYGTLGRFHDQGALYERLALSENDAIKKAGLLHGAGGAYAMAHDNPKAESILRKVVAEFPSDPRAYQQLATTIYGPREDLQKAKAIILEGIKNGAPPLDLYLSLAEAAQKANSPDESKRALRLAKNALETAAKKGEDPYASYVLIADGARKAGDRDQEMAVLREALELRPHSPELLFRLARLYVEQQNFDRAALYFGKMTDVRPNYADGYFQLALAEEGRYHFAAADTAYARAVELEPENGRYRDRYDEFKRRVTANLGTSIK